MHLLCAFCCEIWNEFTSEILKKIKIINFHAISIDDGFLDLLMEQHGTKRNKMHSQKKCNNFEEKATWNHFNVQF